MTVDTHKIKFHFSFTFKTVLWGIVYMKEMSVSGYDVGVVYIFLCTKIHPKQSLSLIKKKHADQECCQKKLIMLQTG